jgi:hypothetical protein
MFVVAALVFALTWAVATALVSLASFGAAPLWLLLGGPLTVAFWTTVAATRIAKPERLRDRHSERTPVGVHRNGSVASDSLMFFPPFATLALLLVYALPIRSELEGAVAAAALLLALPASLLAARAIRLPAVEGA